MADKVAVEEPGPKKARAPRDPDLPESDAAGDRRAVEEPSRALLAKPKTRWLIIAAILVLIVAAFFMWRYLSSFESTDDAQVDGHLMPLSTRISGYIVKVNVDDNQFVTKGTVLVEIDPRDYQVAVDQARANLADAEATATSQTINVPITNVDTSSQLRSASSDLDAARAGVIAAQKQAVAAQAQLEQTLANDVKIQDDLARYKSLVDKQEVSEQVYDQALAASRASTASISAARASVAAAEQQVIQAQARVTDAEAGVRSAQTAPQQVAAIRARAKSAAAQVEQRQAALEQAELNLQYTKLLAPVDGVVIKNVEVGMNVQPGQQLLSIVPLSDVWITANFKETQLKYMRPGQPVDIQVDANGKTYKGHVDSIAGSSGARLSLLPPENATGNYVKVVQRVPVKIVLNPGEDADHYLRLGMSVEPKVWVK